MQPCVIFARMSECANLRGPYLCPLHFAGRKLQFFANIGTFKPYDFGIAQDSANV